MEPLFILCIRGGHTPGKRPACQLARVTEIRSAARRYYAHLVRSRGETKHPVAIEAEAVIASWNRKPTDSEVRKAKRKLLPV